MLKKRTNFIPLMYFPSFRRLSIQTFPYSLLDILAQSDTSGITALRSFRLLRIFRFIRFMKALQNQISVMISTSDNVMTFLALLLLFIFTSSILGMHLFGGKFQFSDEDGQLVTSRANFDTLFWALVTVFQVGWNNLISNFKAFSVV